MNAKTPPKLVALTTDTDSKREEPTPASAPEAEKEVEIPLPPGPSELEKIIGFASHPARRWDRTVVLVTETLKSICNCVVDALYNGEGGYAFIGITRFGKSYSLRYVMAKILQTFPHVRVIDMEINERSVPSQLGFYGFLLECAGCHLPKAISIDARTDQLLNYLSMIAAPVINPTVILFIDEGQNLAVVQWGWIKFIQNRLESRGIRLLTFTFGQPNLRDKIQAFEAQNRQDITERFFRVLHSVKGVESQEQLGAIFKALDSTMRFPAKTGWSFSQFHFPKAFASGWRLANEAELAWNAIQHSRNSTDIAMEHIVLSIKFYLTQFSEFDQVNWKGTHELWTQTAAHR